MAETFRTAKQEHYNQWTGEITVTYVAIQKAGNGRVEGFHAVRSNGDVATFKSRSGAYRYGAKYFHD